MDEFPSIVCAITLFMTKAVPKCLAGKQKILSIPGRLDVRSSAHLVNPLDDFTNTCEAGRF